jgi:transcriptional regulator with GAF, ATPase, and Fis domain
MNCATLPPTLAESELFGFRKGAFSDATEDRRGLVRSAHGGTLFLDEVVELRPSVQASLLRVLQEREVVPLGSTRPVRVDFHLIAASHCDLDEAVAAGRFREDLRARLDGVMARLPPLRERREDMGVLLDAITESAGARALLLGRQAARELLLRPWRRNIRELMACLDVARTLAREGVIEPHHLRGELVPAGAPPIAPPAVAPQLAAKDAARRDRLDTLLREHHGNVTHVARALGKRPAQVYRWLDRCGLDPSTYR